MTLEQALKRIQDKNSQIIQLQKDIAETKSKLKELTLYGVGDKVLVDNKYECYIADVEYISWGDSWKYQLNKVKKDGTMSGQSAGIYSYKTVTLIAKAEKP